MLFEVAAHALQGDIHVDRYHFAAFVGSNASLDLSRPSGSYFWRCQASGPQALINRIGHERAICGRKRHYLFDDLLARSHIMSSVS